MFKTRPLLRIALILTLPWLTACESSSSSSQAQTNGKLTLHIRSITARQNGDSFQLDEGTPTGIPIHLQVTYAVLQGGNNIPLAALNFEDFTFAWTLQDRTFQEVPTALENPESLQPILTLPKTDNEHTYTLTVRAWYADIEEPTTAFVFVPTSPTRQLRNPRVISNIRYGTLAYGLGATLTGSADAEYNGQTIPAEELHYRWTSSPPHGTFSTLNANGEIDGVISASDTSREVNGQRVIFTPDQLGDFVITMEVFLGEDLSVHEPHWIHVFPQRELNTFEVTLRDGLNDEVTTLPSYTEGEARSPLLFARLRAVDTANVLVSEGLNGYAYDWKVTLKTNDQTSSEIDVTSQVLRRSEATSLHQPGLFIAPDVGLVPVTYTITVTARYPDVPETSASADVMVLPLAIGIDGVADSYAAGKTTYIAPRKIGAQADSISIAYRWELSVSEGLTPTLAADGSFYLLPANTEPATYHLSLTATRGEASKTVEHVFELTESQPLTIASPKDSIEIPQDTEHQGPILRLLADHEGPLHYVLFESESPCEQVDWRASGRFTVHPTEGVIYNERTPLYDPATQDFLFLEPPQAGEHYNLCVVAFGPENLRDSNILSLTVHIVGDQDGILVPFRVGSVDQLEGIGDGFSGSGADFIYLRTEAALRHNYVLTQDLDAAQQRFSPIGGQEQGFSGHFDGQGYTIYGVSIEEEANLWVGLFGYVEAAGVVENVSLWGGSVRGNGDVGGLVGLNAGIVRRSASTTTVEGTGHVGGLVGRNLGVVSESFAAGTVVGVHDVGGLIGRVTDPSSEIFEPAPWPSSVPFVGSSFFAGHVTGTHQVGGLIGQSAAGMYRQLFALGRVDGTSWTGGLVGLFDGGDLRDSYVHNDIFCPNSSVECSAGSLVGRFSASASAGTISDGYSAARLHCSDEEGACLLGTSIEEDAVDDVFQRIYRVEREASTPGSDASEMLSGETKSDAVQLKSLRCQAAQAAGDPGDGDQTVQDEGLASQFLWDDDGDEGLTETPTPRVACDASSLARFPWDYGSDAAWPVLSANRLPAAGQRAALAVDFSTWKAPVQFSQTLSAAAITRQAEVPSELLYLWLFPAGAVAELLSSDAYQREVAFLMAPNLSAAELPPLRLIVLERDATGRPLYLHSGEIPFSDPQ